MKELSTEIIPGNWYMCLQSIIGFDENDCPLHCYEGYIYKCSSLDGGIIDHYNCTFFIPEYYYYAFRLATKEEIKDVSLHGSPKTY